MNKSIIQVECILLYVGHMVLVTDAYFFRNHEPSSICENNQNANPLIQGNSQNMAIDFFQVINTKEVFILYGDPRSQTDGCGAAIKQRRHRKGRFYDGTMWDLDCWEPSECTMYEQGIYLKLVPVSASVTDPVKVRTVLLPLDEHETATYTFLPSVSRDSIFFVTAMLSGCSVIVANPDNINCNLIVIHTNYRCSDPARRIDYNHLQAMAVLQEVQNTNRRCRYQIERRWAVDYWRTTIEDVHYEYNDRIFYYNINAGAWFLYAIRIGGNGQRWQFCIKFVIPNPPPPTCFFI